ncbi:hypothetical protein N7510_005712 [Penicillium lagena]|uniref:uncharacterized protein n=1 Tax=Penicillium lagena TaxID=94218 RepID=UPI002541D963|nr:uncharacterized protein N7510_005712 [Penicillium lagena]KAJ5612518.1 hypothetical protein N7510_005712 [Penicillium lagena]
MTAEPPPPSRLALAKQAQKYRILSSLLSLLDRYLSWPWPSNPSLEFSIPSTISKHPGSIGLYFFTAPSRALTPNTIATATQSTQDSHSTPRPKRPVLINFHGGGFSIAHARDDARWATAVVQAIPDAVVVSVNYRLAPEHPFPVGIEDCVDAVLWLWDHAEQYNLDQARFALSGSSAGGNFALAVPFRLREELDKRASQFTNGLSLAGIVGFYPSTDWTRARAERDATNPIAKQKSMISPSIFRFFDQSYLMPEDLPKSLGDDGIYAVDMAHPFLSPGLAPASLLLASYPPAVAIYTCGWDQLLVEGNTFRNRLAGLVAEGQMKHVGGMVIEDKIHAFDKKPSFWAGNPKRDVMYADAIRELGMMWT